MPEKTDGRLIIVSNRVAMPKKKGAAAGGLAVGILAALIHIATGIGLLMMKKWAWYLALVATTGIPRSLDRALRSISIL